MKKQMHLPILVIFLVSLLTLPQVMAQRQAASGSQAPFVSGGVGEDSAARMAALGKEYNLKLLFAAKDGHYLADVAVTISDAHGGKVLETVSEGPFLFARLAPGKYQVTARYAGVSSTRETTIANAGRRELVFRWEEPGD